MIDLPGRIAAVIATRRAACDEHADWYPLDVELTAERRSYLTALENITAIHVKWLGDDECTECGEGVIWPCPTLSYVAAALGIDTSR